MSQLAIASILLLLGATASEPPPSNIRYNQHGMATTGTKRFIVANPARAPLPWRLVTSDARVVAAGQSIVFGADAASGEHVHRVEITQPIAPGRYSLTIGTTTSRAVVIADRPYAGLFVDAMSFFYQQRAGVPISRALVQRPDLARPAGHAREIVGCFDGVDRQKVKWPGCAYKLNVTGGWYDAGDHGKYVVNGGIAAWALLNAHERAPSAPLLGDSALAVPERGNGIPDLLDEARVEVAFLLAMQIPDGARTPVARGDRIETIDGSGLAHHKVSDVRWTGLPMAPADDPEPRVLFPPSTAATLNLAAVAAQCARVWRTLDPAFAATCLAAAKRAWSAAAREPALIAIDRFDGSGGYGDTKLADERFWAAAELFATTGDPMYLPQSLPTVATEISWADVGTAGIVSLLTAPNALPAVQRDALQTTLLAAADAAIAITPRQGYAIPYAPARYPWGSNGAILNAATLLGVAYDLTGRSAYRDGVVDALDYVLGRNPLDRSYVTGYGARPMRNPHHRFWAQQADPRYPAPPPGVLSGGANDSSMGDDVARKMKGQCTPQTCWTDDYRAFTQNEVAINWNAPLVWVSAFLETATAPRPVRVP